jgi:hypothetical protein
MASPARVDKMITLEVFLRLPKIDDHLHCLPIAELFGWLRLRPSAGGPSARGESTR